MTGAEIPVGPIVGTVVKVALERVAPAGLARVRSWIHGKTVVVVGPGASGKTTFVRYLQYGIFQHAEPHEKTYAPVESPRFNLRMGADRTLEVLVKSAIDTPGQVADPAGPIAAVRPHAIVVMLDLTQSLNGEGGTAAWLTEFLTRLDQYWQNQKPSKNRLRSLIVVLNKADLASEDTIKAHDEQYRTIVENKFHAGRGPKMQAPVRFKRCVCVENPSDTKWIDSVLVALAEDLTN